MSDAPPPPALVFLKKTEDFERVKRKGRRVTTRFFNLVSYASCHGAARIGVVVGRRFGKAVARNRGKRVFRALARDTHTLLLAGNDIVIFPRRAALDTPHPNLYKVWVTTLGCHGLAVFPSSLTCAS